MKLSKVFENAALTALLATTILAGCAPKKSVDGDQNTENNQGTITVRNNKPCIVWESVAGSSDRKYDFDTEVFVSDASGNSRNGIPFQELSSKGQQYVAKMRQQLPAYCK